MNTNKLILSAAAAHLVTAYHKAIMGYQARLPLSLGIATEAPNDYSMLQNDAAHGVLRVSPENSATSIYGHSGNMTFRVFHDYGHILYHMEFTVIEECALARRQWEDITAFIPNEWQAVCRTVYLADTVEQSLFENRTGDFPADQKAFVLGFLNKHLEQF